jgi:hypothetical protein
MLAQHTSPEDAPLLHSFMSMSMDERWVLRTPQEMFRTFHAFHGEGFDLLLEEILALPTEPPVLAEGFNLLPRLIAPLLSKPERAVWLIPTPQFRRAAFDSRGSTWDIPNRTSDPPRALSNLLARDGIFTDEIHREASELGLPLISVDTGDSIEVLMRRVATALDLRPTPAAETGSTIVG